MNTQDIHNINSETWNKLAEIYQEKFMNLDIYNPSYDLFLSALETEGSSILELGCGPGNITRYLLNKNPKLQITATDVAPNMIKLAQANNPTAICQILDSKNLSTLNENYDGLVAGFCVPYLSTEEVKSVIINAKRILNHHGVIYISFVNGDEKDSGLKTNSMGDQVYFFFHQKEMIQNLLKESGFKLLHDLSVPYKRHEHETEYHQIIISKMTK